MLNTLPLSRLVVPTPGRFRMFKILAIMGLVAGASHTASHAAAQTWDDGGAGNIWSTSAPNWLGGVPWTNGNNAVFSAITGETVEVDGTVAATGLVSNYSAISLTTGYTISDSNGDGLLNLSSGGGGSNSAKPVITATGTNTISANILLSGSTNNNGRVITPGSSLTISGNISESDVAKSISVSGGGSLTLSGSNSFSGGVNIANSTTTLNLGHAQALGSGALAVGANTFVLNNTSGSPLVLANNNITLGGTNLGAGTTSTNNITFSGSNNLSFGTGIVTMNGANRSIGVNSGTLSIGGIAQDATGTARGFFKNGVGTLAITGQSTYSGTTTISAGTLLLNNSPAGGSATGTGPVVVTVGTISGTGSIAGAVTLGNGTGSADSILAPGSISAAGNAGLFTMSDSLTLASDARIVLDINSAGIRGVNYDAVDVGSITFAGSLTFNITTGIGAGNYDLFAISGVSTQGLASIIFTGGFYSSTWTETTPTSGIWTATSGATTFTFDEATGNLVVTVPEPSTCVMLSAAFALVLYKGRRARRE